MHIKFWSENFKGKGQTPLGRHKHTWEIKLKRMLGKFGVNMCTEVSWLRIGNSGGLFWKR
jgi:hypothetical protein